MQVKKKKKKIDVRDKLEHTRNISFVASDGTRSKSSRDDDEMGTMSCISSEISRCRKSVEPH